MLDLPIQNGIELDADGVLRLCCRNELFRFHPGDGVEDPLVDIVLVKIDSHVSTDGSMICTVFDVPSTGADQRSVISSERHWR